MTAELLNHGALAGGVVGFGFFQDPEQYRFHIGGVFPVKSGALQPAGSQNFYSIHDLAVCAGVNVCQNRDAVMIADAAEVGKETGIQAIVDGKVCQPFAQIRQHPVVQGGVGIPEGA